MKPETWMRKDLQEKYDKLKDQQQPFKQEHRKIREKLEQNKNSNTPNDEKDVQRLREINKQLSDLESEKNKLWQKNLDFFHDLFK